MKKCTECGNEMIGLEAKTPEGISYSYYRCKKCGEEIVDKQQLHEVAEKYRTLKRYNVKLSRWGLSLGIRIPKDLIKRYKLKEETKVSIIPDKKGIRIVPNSSARDG